MKFLIKSWLIYFTRTWDFDPGRSSLFDMCCRLSIELFMLGEDVLQNLYVVLKSLLNTSGCMRGFLHTPTNCVWWLWLPLFTLIPKWLQWEEWSLCYSFSRIRSRNSHTNRRRVDIHWYKFAFRLTSELNDLCLIVVRLRAVHNNVIHTSSTWTSQCSNIILLGSIMCLNAYIAEVVCYCQCGKRNILSVSQNWTRMIFIIYFLSRIGKSMFPLVFSLIRGFSRSPSVAPTSLQTW